jgi:hypothetical protein
MRGHFERIRNAEDLLPLQLEKLVQSMGAFDFNRIEDQIDDPNDPGTVYFAETGRANQEVTHGRIYKLEVDPANPREAALSVVLDAAAGDDIFNPDNLGISDTALVIQEDRNWKKSGFNRVLVYTGGQHPDAGREGRPEAVDRRRSRPRGLGDLGHRERE